MTKQILIITLTLLSIQPAYSMEFNRVNPRTIIAIVTGVAVLGAAYWAHTHEIPSRLLARIRNCPVTHNAANMPTLPPAPEQQAHIPQEAAAISSYSSEISGQPAVGSSAPSIITTHYCSQTGKQEDHPVGILCLPSYALENICQYLKFKDVSALRRSCKQFCLVWQHETALQFKSEDLRKFAGKKIDWLAAGMAFLSNKLKNCRNPLALDLICNELTELPQEIQQLSYLQRLDLLNSNLSQDAIRNLCLWLPTSL